MNEISKSSIKPYKAFLILLVYMLAVMYIFNMTVARFNLLLCDILTLVSICIGVYFLYRYSVLSYRYILDEENLSIIKIAGKNNEQAQAYVEIKNIISFEKCPQKVKGALNYCADFKKDKRYLLKAEVDGKVFDIVFEPSDEFAKELSKRKDSINEEI